MVHPRPGAICGRGSRVLRLFANTGRNDRTLHCYLRLVDSPPNDRTNDRMVECSIELGRQEENAVWDQVQAKDACLRRLGERGFPEEMTALAEASDRFYELGVYYRNPLEVCPFAVRQDRAHVGDGSISSDHGRMFDRLIVHSPWVVVVFFSASVISAIPSCAVHRQGGRRHALISARFLVLLCPCLFGHSDSSRVGSAAAKDRWCF